MSELNMSERVNAEKLLREELGKMMPRRERPRRLEPKSTPRELMPSLRNKDWLKLPRQLPNS